MMELLTFKAKKYPLEQYFVENFLKTHPVFCENEISRRVFARNCDDYYFSIAGTRWAIDNLWRNMATTLSPPFPLKLLVMTFIYLCILKRPLLCISLGVAICAVIATSTYLTILAVRWTKKLDNSTMTTLNDFQYASRAYNEFNIRLRRACMLFNTAFDDIYLELKCIGHDTEVNAMHQPSVSKLWLDSLTPFFSSFAINVSAAIIAIFTSRVLFVFDLNAYKTITVGITIFIGVIVIIFYVSKVIMLCYTVTNSTSILATETEKFRLWYEEDCSFRVLMESMGDSVVDILIPICGKSVRKHEDSILVYSMVYYAVANRVHSLQSDKNLMPILMNTIFNVFHNVPDHNDNLDALNYRISEADSSTDDSPEVVDSSSFDEAAHFLISCDENTDESMQGYDVDDNSIEENVQEYAVNDDSVGEKVLQGYVIDDGSVGENVLQAYVIDDSFDENTSGSVSKDEKSQTVQLVKSEPSASTLMKPLGGDVSSLSGGNTMKMCRGVLSGNCNCKNLSNGAVPYCAAIAKEPNSETGHVQSSTSIEVMASSETVPVQCRTSFSDKVENNQNMEHVEDKQDSETETIRCSTSTSITNEDSEAERFQTNPDACDVTKPIRNRAGSKSREERQMLYEKYYSVRKCRPPLHQNPSTPISGYPFQEPKSLYHFQSRCKNAQFQNPAFESNVTSRSPSPIAESEATQDPFNPWGKTSRRKSYIDDRRQKNEVNKTAMKEKMIKRRISTSPLCDSTASSLPPDSSEDGNFRFHPMSDSDKTPPHSEDESSNEYEPCHEEPSSSPRKPIRWNMNLGEPRPQSDDEPTRYRFTYDNLSLDLLDNHKNMSIRIACDSGDEGEAIVTEASNVFRVDEEDKDTHLLLLDDRTSSDRSGDVSPESNPEVHNIDEKLLSFDVGDIKLRFRPKTQSGALKVEYRKKPELKHLVFKSQYKKLSVKTKEGYFRDVKQNSLWDHPDNYSPQY